jgi:hypothetical protein
MDYLHVRCFKTEQRWAEHAVMCRKGSKMFLTKYSILTSIQSTYSL